MGDQEALLRLAAESDAWIALHLAIVFGVALFVGGLVALSYSLRGDRAEPLARLATAGALTGGAVSLVQRAIDTAYGKVADDWASVAGTDKETLVRIASAVEDVDFTMFSISVVLFYGVTFVLYGLAVSVSDAYPRRLGWIAVFGGAGAGVVGIAQVFTGPSVLTLFVFPAFAALLALWLLAMGVLLWRRADAPDD